MRSFARRLGLLAVLMLMAGLIPSSASIAQQHVDRSWARRLYRSTRPLGLAGARRGSVQPARASASAPRSLTPVSSLSFDAIPRLEPAWPADPIGAIGDSWFVTAVNVHVAVYDLAGVVALTPVSLESLFGLPAGTQVFDPKVVYDQYADTFVLVFLGVHDGKERGWILAVSIPNATANDRSTWCGSKIKADQLKGDGNQWGDYPGLGFDANRVTVTTNQFDFGGAQRFRYAQILSFEKTNLYDCSQSLTFEVLTGKQTRNPNGRKAFTFQPAVTVGAAPSDQLLLSFQGSLTVWRLKERGGKLRLSAASMATGSYDFPPPGTQGGGSLTDAETWWDPGDFRLINAFYDADLDRLYAAHAAGADLLPDTVTGGYIESIVRWYEVDPGAPLSSSAITRQGDIGTAETDAGWPVVATDGSGNLFVTYSRASAVTGEFLSAWAAEIAPGSTTATTALLAAGTATFDAFNGPERWGDYNGISRDPLNPSRIAMVNQYAASDGDATTANWQQTVDVVSHV